MTLAQLVHTLRQKGVTLSSDGVKLKCTAPSGVLDEELSRSIREHKAELIALVTDLSTDMVTLPHSPIEAAPDRTEFPLSFTQRRLLSALKGRGILPTALELRGPLDREALRRTLDAFVERHGVLRRASIDERRGTQRLSAHSAVELPVHSLSHYREEERQPELRKRLFALSRRDFVFGRDLPYRFELFELDTTEHVLFAAFSPLVFDGWCFDIFWGQLTSGYAAAVAGDAQTDSDRPAIEYADFVAWQARTFEQRSAALEEHWSRTLGPSLPPHALPTDLEPNPGSASQSALARFRLGAKTTRALRSFASECGVTSQVVLLAALAALLGRISSGTPVVVATPVDGRTRPELETLVGPTTNLVLLSIEVNPEQTFSQHVRQVMDVCTAAYEHQDLPVDRLRVRSAPSRRADGPAFQVEFSYQRVDQRAPHMGSLEVSQLELPSGAGSEVTFWVKDWGDRIDGAIEYRADLFHPATVEHWRVALEELLDATLAKPTAALATHELGPRGRMDVEAARRAAQQDPDNRALFDALRTAIELRVTDGRGLDCHLGQAGRLEVRQAAEWEPIAEQVVLSSNGKLRRVEAASLAADEEDDLPRDDVERQIVDLFASVLDSDRVSPTSNYFQLGGNSLLLVRLFGRLRSQFGVDLPLTTILRAPSPRALAGVIKGETAPRTGSLVELKPGGEECLFLIHDADGETLLYLQLAQLMPAFVSVYGVEPLRVGDLPMVHASVEAMAAHYKNEIRKRKPEGPYYVGGLCAGGVIAFEVARQLSAEGCAIGLLLLLESAPPAARKRVTIAQERFRRLTGALREASHSFTERGLHLAHKLRNVADYELRRLSTTALNAVLYRTLEDVYPRLGRWPSALPKLTPREIYERAEPRYRPPRTRIPNTVLVRASKGSGTDRANRDLLLDPLFDWPMVLDAALEVVDAPGGHAEMLRRPNVETIAPKVRESFERARDGGL